MLLGGHRSVSLFCLSLVESSLKNSNLVDQNHSLCHMRLGMTNNSNVFYNSSPIRSGSPRAWDPWASQVTASSRREIRKTKRKLKRVPRFYHRVKIFIAGPLACATRSFSSIEPSLRRRPDNIENQPEWGLLGKKGWACCLNYLAIFRHSHLDYVVMTIQGVCAPQCLVTLNRSIWILFLTFSCFFSFLGLKSLFVPMTWITIFLRRTF